MSGQFLKPKEGGTSFSRPGVIPSWENFMDGLKLLDALQPLEHRRVDDLLRQARNL